MKLQAYGRVPHQEILSRLLASDVFFLPTKHSGEGHNNATNEALMSGCLVVTTRHGFMGDILSNDTAIFLDNISSEEISNKIIQLCKAKDTAKKIAKAGNQLFLNNFRGSIVFRKFEVIYSRMVKG